MRAAWVVAAALLRATGASAEAPAAPAVPSVAVSRSVAGSTDRTEYQRLTREIDDATTRSYIGLGLAGAGLVTAIYGGLGFAVIGEFVVGDLKEREPVFWTGIGLIAAGGVFWYVCDAESDRLFARRSKLKLSLLPVPVGGFGFDVAMNF